MVHFVEAKDHEDTYALLLSGAVDLVAGSRVTLQSMYKEPTTGVGYTYTRPYYYRYQNEADAWDALALMTRSDDHQWSDFVFWVVNAVVLAEEQGISQDSYTEMPLVSLFGELNKQIFLDSIYAVGSYGDIYNRTMESIVPRQGSPNMLNANLNGPQHIAIPFS